MLGHGFCSQQGLGKNPTYSCGCPKVLWTKTLCVGLEAGVSNVGPNFIKAKQSRSKTGFQNTKKILNVASLEEAIDFLRYFYTKPSYFQHQSSTPNRETWQSAQTRVALGPSAAVPTSSKHSLVAWNMRSVVERRFDPPPLVLAKGKSKKCPKGCVWHRFWG